MTMNENFIAALCPALSRIRSQVTLLIVAIVGALAGTYYGGVAGMILGAALGQGISTEQARFYDEQLAQGHYLLVIEGSEAELKQAESLLKDRGVQNWTEHRVL